MILKEGEALIDLSEVPATFKGPAKRRKVFYNPAMENNRTICVLMCNALGIKSFLDGFAATGVRGIRVMKEAFAHVVFNDREKEAFLAIRKNLELNGLEAEILNEDFCALERRAELCDIDPFGTPEPFLSKGLKLAESFLAVTATDTAVLFSSNGSNAKKCYERYGAMVKRVRWNKELGARVMCYAVAERAKELGMGIKPLFVYAEDHYLRGYFQLCDCESEVAEVDGMGPIWVGSLKDNEVLKRALHADAAIEKRYAVQHLLSRAIEELDVIGYYDLDDLSSKLRAEEPKAQALVEKLRERGFRASRTIFSAKGIKSDAPLAEIEACFSSASGI
jgi:tRNA (guanine26-N2/guanine27-N2)-dimethyltransferase